jgi:acyl carrier protein
MGHRCAALVSSTISSPGSTMKQEQIVRDFFAQYSKSPLPEGQEGLEVHYLDAGLIDSFGIVTMISDFEGALGITFAAEDMQSREFETVGGLIGILDRLTAARAT